MLLELQGTVKQWQGLLLSIQQADREMKQGVIQSS